MKARVLSQFQSVIAFIEDKRDTNNGTHEQCTFRPAFDDLEGRRLLASVVTLPQTSSFAPAVAAFNGKLYIAWTGTDPGHHLNIESSSNGVTFGNKVTLPETSDAAPRWPSSAASSISPGRGPIPLTTSTSSRRPMACSGAGSSPSLRPALPVRR